MLNGHPVGQLHVFALQRRLESGVGEPTPVASVAEAIGLQLV